MSQTLARTDGGGRLLLLVAAMMMVAMAGVLGLRSMASAQGSPNAICQAMGFDYGFKVEQDPTGTHTVTYEDAQGETQTAGSLTVTENEDETGIDWSSDFAISAVIVNGGGTGNHYSYPGGSMGDSGLVTNVNLNNPNGYRYELSNVVFCYDVAETGGEDPQVIQYTVSIAKWVDGATPTEGSFAFTSTWTAGNLNGGAETSGNFTLDAGNSYMAITSAMDAGASYGVVENGIDGTCDEGDEYRLLGYGIGLTLEAAAAAEPVTTAAFADLQASQHVVVQNESCAAAEQHTVTITKYVDGALAAEGSFEFTATWTAANLNGGLEATGNFTLNETNGFVAVTSAMDAGASYSVVENGIDAVCEGDDTYRLAGYTMGETLEEALAAEPMSDVNIEALNADLVVIVWNQNCANLGSITIVKDFLPDAAAIASFTAEGLGVADFSIAEGAEHGMTFETLGIGDYTFTEEFLAGWRIQSIICEGQQSPSHILINLGAASVTVSLTAGGDITCTFTNVEDASTVPGNITIVKNWGEDAGVDTTFTVSENLGVDGNTFTLMDSAGADSVAFEGLAPATYTFTEGELEGWTLMGINCTGMNSPQNIAIDLTAGSLGVTLTPGESVVCTFTNSMDDVNPVETGSITINKVVAPAGTVAMFNFTTTGEGLAAFGLVTGDAVNPAMASFTGLTAGSYAITETAIDGWNLTSLECTGAGEGSVVANLDTDTVAIELVAGANIVCTFTNTAVSQLVGETPIINDGTNPIVNVPSTDNTNVGSEQPAPGNINVPSVNVPNPGIVGSTDPFLNPAQQPANQPALESAVLGERTPLAPATGNAIAGNGNAAATPLGLGIIVAFLLGGTAMMGRMARRAR